MCKLKLNTINHLKWRSFWSAAALCRFGNQVDYQSGRGLPHSKGFAILSGLLYSTLVCTCFSQLLCRTLLIKGSKEEPGKEIAALGSSFEPLILWTLCVDLFP